MKKYIKKHSLILKLVKDGKSFSTIGDKFGISKQRISQIVRQYTDIDTIYLRRKKRNDDFENTIIKIRKDLESGLSKKEIRDKYKLNNHQNYYLLNNKGLDLRAYDKKALRLLYVKCFKLYKSGLTGSEIIKLLPQIKDVNTVYSYARKANNGHLPKRLSSIDKRRNAIDKEIIRLSNKKLNHEEIFNFLKNKGFKNLFGGELKISTIHYRYYKINKVPLHHGKRDRA